MAVLAIFIVVSVLAALSYAKVPASDTRSLKRYGTTMAHLHNATRSAQPPPRDGRGMGRTRLRVDTAATVPSRTIDVRCNLIARRGDAPCEVHHQWVTVAEG